jgi:hypothetical protein
MSDSAKGNAPKPEAKTSEASHPQTTVEPAAAEEFASSFVPVWQFEEAPFSAGADLEAAELLPATSTASHPPSSFRTLPGPDPHAARLRDEAIRTEPSVIIADESSAEALPSAPVLPIVAPLATFDEDEVFPARSNKRLFIGAGAVVLAVVLVSTVVLITRAGPPAPLTPLSTSPPARAAGDIPIPPPPPPSETTLAPSTTAAPAAEQAARSPSPTVEVFPPPAATPSPTFAPAPPPPRPVTPLHAQESARPLRNAGQTPKLPAKSGAGGIVRDNPF